MNINENRRFVIKFVESFLDSRRSLARSSVGCHRQQPAVDGNDDDDVGVVRRFSCYVLVLSLSFSSTFIDDDDEGRLCFAKQK